LACFEAVIITSIYVCVCSFIDELASQLVALSSSPVLAVRRLSSQALAKLIPQCNVSSFINNIISSLPSANVSGVNYNKLHGQLLQVHHLSKYLLTAKVHRCDGRIIFDFYNLCFFHNIHFCLSHYRSIAWNLL